MAEAPQQTEALLRLLDDAGIPFLVIGGVAAITWGASEFTRDLDVCMDFTEANVTRLLEALAPHRPRHLTRQDLGRIADPPHALVKFRSLLLVTDLGRLDVLRDVPPTGGYAELAARGKQVTAYDRTLHVIGLDDLITIKEHVARPKDLVVAAQLRAIRAALPPG